MQCRLMLTKCVLQQHWFIAVYCTLYHTPIGVCLIFSCVCFSNLLLLQLKTTLQTSTTAAATRVAQLEIEVTTVQRQLAQSAQGYQEATAKATEQEHSVCRLRREAEIAKERERLLTSRMESSADIGSNSGFLNRDLELSLQQANQRVSKLELERSSGAWHSQPGEKSDDLTEALQRLEKLDTAAESQCPISDEPKGESILRVESLEKALADSESRYFDSENQLKLSIEKAERLAARVAELEADYLAATDKEEVLARQVGALKQALQQYKDQRGTDAATRRGLEQALTEAASRRSELELSVEQKQGQQTSRMVQALGAELEVVLDKRQNKEHCRIAELEVRLYLCSVSVAMMRCDCGGYTLCLSSFCCSSP